MRSRLLLLFLVLAMTCSAGATRAGEPFFDFFGYSYLDGAAYTTGTVTSIPMVFDSTQPNPVFALDLQHFEYTVMVSNMVITDVQTAGAVRFITYAGGQIGVYEDPSRNSQWFIDPPNASVPGVFTDGTQILSGAFSECVLMFDTASRVGSVQGRVTFTGGSRLGELPTATGWLFFGGTTTNPSWNIPEGFDMAWDPQLISPDVVATRQTSWGRIRSLYR